jgi:hypothetical protein
MSESAPVWFAEMVMPAMRLVDTSSISPGREPDPIEIDPRPCEWCGLTIDQHRMVDIGEGPEFFCDELETQIYLEAADLVRQWELADPRDRWRHTGEAQPKPSAAPRPCAARPYRTPQATIDAFLYVVSLRDRDCLAKWLARHPADRAELLRIWKGKRC